MVNFCFCIPSVPLGNVSAVGTSVAAIVALLVAAGGNKVSTKDAFTLFENNTGWANSTCNFTCLTSVFQSIFATDGWAFLLAFTAPMWTLTGCATAFVYIITNTVYL